MILSARSFLATLLLIALAAGCSRPPASTSATDAPTGSGPLTKIVVQLDWVPEPEHGGLFQAQATGRFTAAGLDVELIPGGPNAFVMQKLATAQAHVGQADSTNTLRAIAEGLPVIHIGAVFQNDPSVLMLHADNPVDSFEALNGKTIMARPEWALLSYLRNKYGIDFNIIPQNFSVANFIADQSFIQQGFYIAEPFHILSGGAQPPKFLYAWDAGFDAYTALVANQPWARANAPALRAFMAATIEGWRDYLEGDPTPAHELMKQLHPSNTDAFLAYSRQMIIDEKLVIGRGPDGGNHQIGRVSRERFATQISQLETLNILPPGKLTVDRVVTLDYLPD
jgi:NitT/TauT family transport system substrate-binding protein